VLCAGCDTVFQLERDLDAFVPPDASVDASLAGCPASYQAVPGGETRYLFVPGASKWLGAQADCADDSSPSITHLVEFTDDAEVTAVQTAAPFLTPWTAWTGYARDTGSNPYVFYATTGPLLPLTSTAWAGGEPDGPASQSEETATFFGHNFRVVDGPANFDIPAICECDGRPVTRTFQVLP
jgi:hypothetical protein